MNTAILAKKIWGAFALYKLKNYKHTGLMFKL